MKDFKIAQLTKVMVVERLRKFDDRSAAATELFKQVLLVALKEALPTDPGWGRVVEDAAQGTVTALVLCKLDLADAAVKLLTAAGEVAYQLNLEPECMRESTLRGIVGARQLISADETLRIQFSLAKHFPKAAKLFSSLFYTDLVQERQAA